MADEGVVFRKGTHRASGDGWKAVVVVPRDLTVADVERPLRALRESRGGRKR